MYSLSGASRSAPNKVIVDETFRVRSVPRVWWWDVGVPLFSWAVLGCFLFVPPSMRVFPLCVLLGPPALGSRRNEWWTAAMRRIAKVKRFTIQSDAKLPEERPCILGIHPHGKYPMSLFPAFETRPDLFATSKFVMAQSSLGKYVPTVGWVTMLCGRAIDASRKQISQALASGKHVGLMPGGAREMVLCEPFSETIPLVRHTSFLRLVHNLATDCGVHHTRMTDGDGNAPYRCCAVVVPCFVFGIYDSFTNPLAQFDAALYRNTGLNLPLWLPAVGRGKSSDRGTCMVVGEAIDPRDFDNPEDFASQYYASLETLFKTNKRRFGAYKDRRLEWIPTDPQVKQQARMGRKVSMHAFTTKFTLAFLAFYAVAFALRGELLRLSTSSVFDPNNYKRALFVHTGACLTWVLASAMLTNWGFRLRHHRKVVGYVALLASTIMCGSAYHLAVTSWSNALLMLPSSNSNRNAIVPVGGAFTAAIHAAFHSFSNLHIAALFQMMLGLAIAAAGQGDGERHYRYTGMVHMSVVTNFPPRVMGWVVRWVLPHSWMDGVAAFSVGLAFQWWVQIGKVLPACRDEEVRGAILAQNKASALLSAAALVVEWSCGLAPGFQSARLLFSVVYPIAAFLAGTTFYIPHHGSSLSGVAQVKA